MVIALDTGQVADLVFVIEGTANMGAYLGELKANYVIPTLEWVQCLGVFFPLHFAIFNRSLAFKESYFFDNHRIAHGMM